MNIEDIPPVSEGTSILLYVIYAVIALGLVAWLGRTLYSNGAVFLRDVFDDVEVAEGVNRLLVVGFYVLNLGLALRMHQIPSQWLSLTEAVNLLILKVGSLLLVLGVIHLVNMAVFWRFRVRGQRSARIASGASLPAANAFLPQPPAPGPAAGPSVPAPA